jgi:Zn-dependent protease with chaperone function
VTHVDVMHVCHACATQLVAGTRFCTECGTPQSMSPQAVAYYGCATCGGDGSRLPAHVVYCARCRWLRPLAPDYYMDTQAFLWSLDAQAMTVLESLGPVTAAARALSGRVGRPWFEATVNGIRLSDQQFPDIFTLGIRAARIMGLRQMPELYISGEMLWDAMTLGSDEQAFIVLGSVLTYFKGDEMLYLLGREMGHIRAGHVMWRTASKFVTGSTHMNRSVMGSGLLNVLTPGKMLENVIDAPIMAWARHSEITADRAGLLVTGNVEVARKVLMTSSLKSFPLFQRINQDDWLHQEEASDDQIMRLSEMTMSTSPFLARRMRMLREFASAPHAEAWRNYIATVAPATPDLGTPTPAAPAQASRVPATNTAAPPAHRAATPAPLADDDAWRFACRACQTPIRVPRSALAGKRVVRVTCPKPGCNTEMNCRPPRPDPRLVRFACIRCSTPVAVPREQLQGKGVVKVRCPKAECRCVMDVGIDTPS